MNIKENDIIRIKIFPKGDINEFARVDKVTLHGVVVSNMNMPFLGTLVNTFFSYNEIAPIA